ncbi:MAG TPA: rod shape-determining protein MreC [Thermoanaerobaculia bacterium]|jgi:rod shape-determining protein MreC
MRSQNPLGEIAAVNPRRGGIVLAMVLIGCVLILSAQAPGRGSRSTLLQSWILTASAPAVNLIATASRSFWGAIGSIGDLFQARTENARLQTDLDASRRELFRLRAEVKQLEADGRLTAAGAALPGILRSVPILLIERRSGVLSALIAAGSGQGVVPDSPLAVPAGLVGRVVTVGHGVSRAQLLLDASAAAGARIARTGELGVVRGDGKGSMTLNNIATTSSVAKGDWIESAGIDGIYPRGIPIGRVESVSRGSKLFLEIRVAPAADFSRLTDLLLLSPSPATQENPEVGRSATR